MKITNFQRFKQNQLKKMINSVNKKKSVLRKLKTLNLRKVG